MNAAGRSEKPAGITRRVFAGRAAAGLATQSRALAQTPPNIVWISCEDTSPDLGCYGDAYANTPNLDRLAKQGARFTNAFSVYGVCAPSRSSIITSMYPASIGTQHMRSQGVPPPTVKCFTEYLRAAGYYCTNNVKTDYNFAAPLTAWDESSNTAHWRGRTAVQPFFSVFNLTVTHESQIRTSPELFAKQTARLAPGQRHDPEKAQLPPYYPDTPVVRRDWSNYYDLVSAMDFQVAVILKQLVDDGLVDNTIVFFWGDHGRGLPRAKRWVYDSGIRVPLLVRWPGKIPQGSVHEEMVSLMDLGPTVLRLAGLKPPPHMQGQAFLGDSLPPPRQYIHAARDRMDETYDIIRAVRDNRFKYIKNYQPCKPYAQYIDYMDQMPTLREWRRLHKEGKLEGPQKLFFAPEKPEEELYDTHTDAHEVNNLAADPAHLQTLIRLRRAHEEHMTKTGDMALVPEAELLQRMRPGGKTATTAELKVSPVPGRYPKPVRVRLECATAGSSIAYTLDEGERPRWKLYTGDIALEKPAILRARACRIGYEDSPELMAKFEIT